VPAAQVVAAAKQLGCENVSAYDSVAEACRRALEYADGDDAVLVCGSLYTAGEARPVVQRHSN
jgi:dihydrofolate synthase/folylpolyglutamate synthase